MNCDQAQREIVVPSDPRDWRDQLRQARALRHVADCPNCAAFAARLHQLDAQIDTWKASTDAGLPLDFQTHVARAVGDALRDRTAGTLLAAHTAQNAQNKRKRTMSIAATTGAVALAAATITLTSRTQSQQSRPDFVSPASAPQTNPAAISEPVTTPIRNAHVKTWTLNGKGELYLEEEMWYEDGRWRKEGTYGSRLIVDSADYRQYSSNPKKTFSGTYYRYDSARHEVVSMTESGKQRTNFTFDSILPANARKDMTVVSNGGEITVYQLIRKTTRWHFWINSTTGLPVRCEQTTLSGTSAVWQTVYREEYEFNKPLDELLFDSSTLKDEGWRG